MDNNDWKKIITAMALLTQLGLVIIANIGVGFFLGYFLDNLTDRQLIFKIIGLILGVMSGFYSDYRLIKSIMGDNNKD